MEHRQINENYRAIAEKLIAQEPALAYIKDSQVKITYLESDSTKKDGRERLVLGECEKVAAKTNRIARVMELDPHYCDVIRKRWTAWAKENGKEIGSGKLE